eukprot:c1215_g1_i1.p1 GENE.c1215_g1_i1~~c1215_g1_i1.p1  ORF type:complete len:472 (+),score=43.22 c1215_g1_i1:54-1469(+)
MQTTSPPLLLPHPHDASPLEPHLMHDATGQIQDDGKFCCPLQDCGKVFSKQASLLRHTRIHSGDKPYVCTFEGCGRSFSEKSNLKTHTRVHTGERPFVCDFEGCSRGFAQAGTLITHRRTHNGDRPYLCPHPGCEHAFAEKSNLVTHQRIHSGVKPFHCQSEGCGRSFSSAYNLKIHERTHSGDRPFVCQFDGCQKRFSTSGNLKTHMRAHNGEKPFLCPFDGCGKQFTTAGNLKTHQKVHTGDKPFICSFENCQKRFSTAGNLRAHMLATKHCPEKSTQEHAEQTQLLTKVEEAPTHYSSSSIPPPNPASEEYLSALLRSIQPQHMLSLRPHHIHSDSSSILHINPYPSSQNRLAHTDDGSTADLHPNQSSLHTEGSTPPPQLNYPLSQTNHVADDPAGGNVSAHHLYHSHHHQGALLEETVEDIRAHLQGHQSRPADGLDRSEDQQAFHLARVGLPLLHHRLATNSVPQ